MKKNSNAFTIIKSLTMSEKRYFKIFSERHTIGKQNKYVVLFDELDKSETDDDQSLKKNIRKKGCNADFLPADKNYLYKLVLRSLNDFHDSKTFNMEVKDALQSVEILFHKGLYRECLSLINKTEKLTDECESFQLMIDLLMWKKKCAGYAYGLQMASDVNSQINKYLNLLSNLKRITDLYYESNLLQSSNENSSKAEIVKKFENILKHPELKLEKNALSFSAKVFYYLVHSNYHHFINNKQQEFNELRKLVDMLNNSKIYAVENPLDYVSIYNRLLSIKKYFASEDFFKDIKVLREFTNKPLINKEVVVQRVFVHTNTHILEHYLINNEFSEALGKIKGIEGEIDKLNLEIEPYHMMYFYYLHAVVLIFVGQFSKSLKFVNKILNDFSRDARPQVYIRVEMLNIIVHFEMKNFSLVQSLIKQLLKENAKQNSLILFEEKLLKTVFKIASAEEFSIKEEMALYHVLLKDLNAGGERQDSALSGNYERWLIAKTKRKLVYEIF